MALRSTTREGGARRRLPAPPSLLDTYVGLVSALGAAGLVAVVLLTPWDVVLTSASVGPVAFLAVAAVLGELRPLPISRDGEPTESLSTSAPFVVALLAIGGTGAAAVVQAVASLTDDALHRRPLRKSAFNTAQYTVSVLAGRAVFCLLGDVPLFSGPVAVGTHHLLPLLAGGVAMVATNRLLVATVVSLASGQPFVAILVEDARFLSATHAVLISLGGVAAAVAESGVAYLALLTAPVVAAYVTTEAAIRHAHRASHDALTGLPNRDRLAKRLGDALTEDGTGAVRPTGLILLDLDHFKNINDTLGHPVGDELLQQVAARLTAVLPDPRRAHRLGGDEFAVIVDGDAVTTESQAHDLLAALEAPMHVEDVALLVRASVGVAVAPEHGTDAQALMKNADIALYQAKRDRDGISTYAPELDVNSVDRLRVLADLRDAIDTDQLEVVYQPQVDLASGRTVGVEALIRWHHPLRGPVPPDTFIPLAENSGLIGEVTAYVLRVALGTLAQWRAAGHDVRMAVNLSARHLSDVGLPGQVAAALDRADVPSSAVVLEVTETGILNDPARVDVVMLALRHLGVSVAVDDYGTGHASLGYLKRLSVDELKVDRSFVGGMSRDHHDFVIVRSTIALARDLGLRVVAEGVEDEGTATALRDLGCGIGQGYHLGRPTDAATVLARLEAERTHPVVPTPRRL